MPPICRSFLDVKCCGKIIKNVRSIEGNYLLETVVVDCGFSFVGCENASWRSSAVKGVKTSEAKLSSPLLRNRSLVAKLAGTTIFGTSLAEKFPSDTKTILICHKIIHERSQKKKIQLKLVDFHDICLHHCGRFHSPEFLAWKNNSFEGIAPCGFNFPITFLPVSMFVRFGSFFTCAFDVKSLLFAITSIVSDSLGGSLIPKPFAFFSVFVVKA